MLVTFLGLWHYAAALILVAAALAAIVYLPGKIGGIGGAVLGACAAALLAYQFGFQERGRLDRTEQLESEIAERQREAVAASQVAQAAKDRADAAQAANADLQAKVDAYVDELSKRPADGRCALTDADVKALNGIGEAKSATKRRPAR